ncbi:MAG: zinc ribbon domain-containing protein [Thermoplasmata archaeon]
MIPRAALLLVPLVLLMVPSAAVGSAGHYIPQTGDRFEYNEVVSVGNGTGDYYGYTESTTVNGTDWVTASAQSNGTVAASYYYAAAYSNVTGASYRWTSSGPFAFSSGTFRYVQGTDNQTGDGGQPVWFYMNNSLGAGDPFVVETTPMTVVSTDYNYELGGATGKYVATISAMGSGAYQRNDGYGVFSASYTWNMYFDPSTGYIVGYLYTETDTNNSGDGFTYTDLLYVTSTTYPLTAGVAPPPATSSSSGLSEPLELALVLLVVVVVIIVVLAIYARSRRKASLPKHSAGGNIGYGPPPGMMPGGVPPPVHLTPSGQPAVQQIVMRETVKVNCRYCGTLIDSTATVCPNCGAPRT